MTNTSDNQHEPEGLGGWLILLAIGIIGSIIRLVLPIDEYAKLVRNSGWQEITNPDSHNYIPYLSTLINAEMINAKTIRLTILFRPTHFSSIFTISILIFVLPLFILSKKDDT